MNEKRAANQVDRFGEYEILHFEAPIIADLSLETKRLIYALYAAGLAGRDIIWDQNYRHNLLIRRFLEEVYRHYQGDRTSDPFRSFEVYLKKIWFSNGIHNRWDSRKIDPGFSIDDLRSLVQDSPNADFPLKGFESLDELILFLEPILFDPDLDAKMTNKDEASDSALSSAVNFYRGVSQDEVERFYQSLKTGAQDDPSFGINSRLVKEEGEIREEFWRIGGRYSSALEQVVFWLEKARASAHNEGQARCFGHLIDYYTSGDPRAFDAYNLEWVKETDSPVDAINGFIETYSDPLGYKGTFESLVSLRDEEGTRRIETIARKAQWFEDHMPYQENHKNPQVKSVAGTVIDVIAAAGDDHPWIPRGINLPNADWIHEHHGSKSVNLGNIGRAAEQAADVVAGEFLLTEVERERSRKHYLPSRELLIDLHEVVGHGSGILNPGVPPARVSLKNYASTLEEARADLVGLYFLLDEELIKSGLMDDLETGRAQYDRFILDGMMLKLHRLPLGSDLEEDHMRAEQLIAAWCLAQGEPDGVIEARRVDDKSYFTITDHTALRELFGKLLGEIQRIKAEGDYKAAKDLVETYGVKVDRSLHAEVLERYRALGVASYRGFVNPVLEPVWDGDDLIDLRVGKPQGYAEQMLAYSREWSFLEPES